MLGDYSAGALGGMLTTQVEAPAGSSGSPRTNDHEVKWKSRRYAENTQDLELDAS